MRGDQTRPNCTKLNGACRPAVPVGQLVSFRYAEQMCRLGMLGIPSLNEIERSTPTICLVTTLMSSSVNHRTDSSDSRVNPD